MALSSGTRFGTFEIQSALGEGGMGEVYRARDTKLARDVALKILPQAFAADPERLARFEREAQVLASLNHPNIAQIYGFEVGAVDGRDGRALVMELVEGTTLAGRIARGAIPLDEALGIAQQVAEALEAAHERGIIHRDVKPANVMVKPDGTVKVLDFGLASVAQGPSASQTNLSQSPTLTIAATQAGVILGTAGYMSPEQAAGKPVDKRADIWSFGVMLWEMLTGRRLFDGETISHTLADVLRAEIDFGKLPGDTPTSIRELLRRCLGGTEGATAGFFWSADSRFVAFATNRFPGRLKKVDISGGPAQPLCEFTGSFRGGDWSAAGVILFGVSPSGIWQVSENGGTPTPVTKLNLARQETQHSGPVFLPDGRKFLYFRASTGGNENQSGIYTGLLDATPEQQSTTRLLVAESNPIYAPSPSNTGGSVLFLRAGTLLAQPFDSAFQPIGNAVSLAKDVGSFGSSGWFSASASGHLAFRTGRAAAQMNQLVWFDRQGKRLGDVGAPMEMGSGGLQLSRDGERVVITRTGPGIDLQEAHVWIADVSRGIFRRLYSGEDADTAPAASPNGYVAFSSTINGAVGDLYWAPANGLGSPEPLLVKSPTVKHPNHFSPDGRFLIYDDHIPPQDLYILPVEAPSAGGERKPIPFAVTKADETFGQFSPDGKWIAYSSDESGRREVYMQGFAPDKVPANAVGKWTISTAGGDKPRWKADGKELYYIALDRKMMAVPVKLAPTFEPGIAKPLFETNVTAFNPYDVSPDGRFLMNTVAASAAPPSSPVTIVLNWQAGLKH